MGKSSVHHIPGLALTGLKYVELKFDICGSDTTLSTGCRKEAKVQKNMKLSWVFVCRDMFSLDIISSKDGGGGGLDNTNPTEGREGRHCKVGSCSLSYCLL
ncbi:UNVERIFIED_CONTAM: hypothetical protein K2H54_040019 [Gekko kuhli]